MSDSFDLIILDSGEPSRAVAYARHANDTAIEFLSCADLANLKSFQSRLNNFTAGNGKRPTAKELAEFGENLFSLLVPSTIRTVYEKLPASFFRIQVLSNQAELQALPWEYLQEPKSPLGPINTRGVVRIVPTLGKTFPNTTKLGAKVRVLFAYADPIDQGPVLWEEIERTIRRDFTEFAGDRLEMTVVEAATLQSLADAFVAGQYDVMHFMGHGTVVRDENNRETGHLVFVNSQTHQHELVSAEKLSNLFRGTGLRLVVLSACSSSAGDFSRNYAVVAQGLVLNGVPAVVANQYPITNTAAAVFARGFYNKLLHTGDVDQAVAAGRMMLNAQDGIGNSAQIEWGIPTLYRHHGAAIIFEK